MGRSTQEEMDKARVKGAAVAGQGWTLTEMAAAVGSLMGSLDIAAGNEWCPDGQTPAHVFTEANRNIALRITLNGNGWVDQQMRWTMGAELPFNVAQLCCELQFWPNVRVEINIDWNLGGTFVALGLLLMKIFRSHNIRCYDAAEQYRVIHQKFPHKAWHPTREDDREGATLSQAFVDFYRLVERLHDSEMPMKTLAIARRTGLL